MDYTVVFVFGLFPTLGHKVMILTIVMTMMMLMMVMMVMMMMMRMMMMMMMMMMSKIVVFSVRLCDIVSV